MIRIAVCDDDACMSDAVRTMAAGFFRRKNREAAVLQFSSGKELLDYDKPVDILFLDIRMKGLDGMETARKLRERDFKGFLIFITVLKEMVFQSFEVQAYDYLLKPLREKQFEKTMERLYASMCSAVHESLLIQKGYDSRIILFDEIVYGEVIDRKIYLHLVSSETVDFYERIENLQARLDSRFFRCHRSFLINLKYLKSFQNGAALMENGREIPVSRLRRKEFSSVILQYMKEWGM